MASPKTPSRLVWITCYEIKKRSEKEFCSTWSIFVCQKSFSNIFLTVKTSKWYKYYDGQTNNGFTYKKMNCFCSSCWFSQSLSYHHNTILAVSLWLQCHYDYHRYGNTIGRSCALLEQSLAVVVAHVAVLDSGSLYWTCTAREYWHSGFC